MIKILISAGDGLWGFNYLVGDSGGFEKAAEAVNILRNLMGSKSNHIIVNPVQDSARLPGSITSGVPQFGSGAEIGAGAEIGSEATIRVEAEIGPRAGAETMAGAEIGAVGQDDLEELHADLVRCDNLGEQLLLDRQGGDQFDVSGTACGNSPVTSAMSSRASNSSVRKRLSRNHVFAISVIAGVVNAGFVALGVGFWVGDNEKKVSQLSEPVGALAQTSVQEPAPTQAKVHIQERVEQFLTRQLNAVRNGDQDAFLATFADGAFRWGAYATDAVTDRSLISDGARYTNGLHRVQRERPPHIVLQKGGTVAFVEQQLRIDGQRIAWTQFVVFEDGRWRATASHWSHPVSNHRIRTAKRRGVLLTPKPLSALHGSVVSGDNAAAMSHHIHSNLKKIDIFIDDDAIVLGSDPDAKPIPERYTGEDARHWLAKYISKRLRWTSEYRAQTVAIEEGSAGWLATNIKWRGSEYRLLLMCKYDYHEWSIVMLHFSSGMQTS